VKALLPCGVKGLKGASPEVSRILPEYLRDVTKVREESGRFMSMLVALGLGSIIFLSVVLIVVALMLRSSWEKMGSNDSSHPPE
jgi:hypothetical protein